jgi:hypothetical protein
VEMPSCYGQPERVPACDGCGVRVACWEKHVTTTEVFLLPQDRPAPRPEDQNVVKAKDAKEGKE